MSFRYSEVVNGDISFSEVVFGEGEVSFSNAKFGNGQVNFSDAKFGNGRVDFTSAELGNRKVTFDKAEFGDRGVCFCDVVFCKTNTNTINGVVTFKEVTFGKGAVDFEHAKFGKGTVNFYKSSFGDGDVNFKDAKFGEGNVDFFSANFGEGDVDFGKAEFGEGNVFFDSCEFKGNISFRELQDVKKLSSFSLRNSIFNKSLDISDNSFNCIPNLSNTKLTNQVSLDRMKVNHPNTYKKGDGESLCRLKEIAEDNKSYQQALDIHVMEMRAKRFECESKPSRILDCFFDKLCVYGQSISRPTICLLVSIAVSWGFYGYCSNLNMENSFLYSLSQALPFVSAGRTSENYNFNKLFTCGTVQEWMYFFSLIQGLFSFVFLFLIGLGLRNRFRL